jgi:hypothetical protein
VRRFLAAIAGLCLIATGSLAFYQSRDSNYNQNIAASGGGYTGPGDVVSGAYAWWGLRCYNNAYSGLVADITDASSGNTTGTRLQCSSGTVSAVVSGSACTFVTGNACSSLATTCASSCNVVTLYDQSGASNCTGPCNMAQASNGARPTVMVSCLNSHPCMVFNGTSHLLQTPNPASSQIQPYTMSGVAERTGNTSVFADIIGANTNAVQFLFNSGANQFTLYAGSVASPVTANDSAYHAIQGVYNGSSSIIYVDGTQTTGLSAGASALGNTAPIILGAGNNYLTGNIAEAGIWPIGLNTTQQSNMNSNQHTYWGF